MYTFFLLWENNKPTYREVAFMAPAWLLMAVLLAAVLAHNYNKYMGV
jgi:hypothetical protein